MIECNRFKFIDSEDSIASVQDKTDSHKICYRITTFLQECLNCKKKDDTCDQAQEDIYAWFQVNRLRLLGKK